MTSAPELPCLPDPSTWPLDADAAMPDCPCCYRPLGLRLAAWNTSGREEWNCDDCGKQGVNEHGR